LLGSYQKIHYLATEKMQDVPRRLSNLRPTATYRIHSNVGNLVLWAIRRSRRRGSEEIGSATDQTTSRLQPRRRPEKRSVKSKEKIMNIEHRTSNIERRILMTLRFIYFKTRELQNNCPQPATNSPRRARGQPSTLAQGEYILSKAVESNFEGSFCSRPSYPLRRSRLAQS